MTQSTITDRVTQARTVLESADQAHVLQFFEQLDQNQKDQLLTQIHGVDWPLVARLIESHVRNKPQFELPKNIGPAPCYPNVPPQELREKYGQARLAGQRLIQQGKVAAFTVAGGQGTRLGWPGPKGTYPATPIRNLPLFACLAEYLRKTEEKFGAPCPWYVMTSPSNDLATRTYFEQHDYFGLDRANVILFPQEMLPAIDMQTGRVLLESPCSIALSPNGHGGSLKALHTSGAIKDMKRRGIEHISYTQIDNPIVKVIDPLFIGLHALDRCEMSSKMLPKTGPNEKVGNFCEVDGRITVIEYSDLPDELAQQKEAGGGLRFRAGSIAIHILRVDFVESLNSDDGEFALPYHRAQKKVDHTDLETGKQVVPTDPNAVKLEMFVFDALTMCKRSIIYETDRIEEFAPIKNAQGVDSPESSRQIQTERVARWLAAKGVKIPRDQNGSVDAVIEISQLTAIEPDDLKAANLPEAVDPGTELLI